MSKKFPFYRTGKILALLANTLRKFGFPLFQISLVFENGDEKIYQVCELYVGKHEGYRSAVSMPYERSIE